MALKQIINFVTTEQRVLDLTFDELNANPELYWDRPWRVRAVHLKDNPQYKMFMDFELKPEHAAAEHRVEVYGGENEGGWDLFDTPLRDVIKDYREGTSRLLAVGPSIVPQDFHNWSEEQRNSSLVPGGWVQFDMYKQCNTKYRHTELESVQLTVKDHLSRAHYGKPIPSVVMQVEGIKYWAIWRPSDAERDSKFVSSQFAVSAELRMLPDHLVRSAVVMKFEPGDLLGLPGGLLHLVYSPVKAMIRCSNYLPVHGCIELHKRGPTVKKYGNFDGKYVALTRGVGYVMVNASVCLLKGLDGDAKPLLTPVFQFLLNRFRVGDKDLISFKFRGHGGKAPSYVIAHFLHSYWLKYFSTMCLADFLVDFVMRRNNKKKYECCMPGCTHKTSGGMSHNSKRQATVHLRTVLRSSASHFKKLWFVNSLCDCSECASTQL